VLQAVSELLDATGVQVCEITPEIAAAAAQFRRASLQIRRIARSSRRPSSARPRSSSTREGPEHSKACCRRIAVSVPSSMRAVLAAGDGKDLIESSYPPGRWRLASDDAVYFSPAAPVAHPHPLGGHPRRRRQLRAAGLAAVAAAARANVGTSARVGAAGGRTAPAQARRV
jgi:hypothetical protein